MQKLDIFNHIFPKPYYDLMMKSNCLPLWVDQGDGGVVGSTKD